MATDKDYRDQGLTALGVRRARNLDEWLELIVDEVSEYNPGSDPWEVRDFIARCVDATALSDERVRAYWRRKDGLAGPSSG